MIFPSRTLSVAIDCPSDRVCKFVSDPANLPQWATAFCNSARRSADGWVIETAQGPVPIRFVEANPFGVLDHYVNPAPGVEIHVPMRVVANGSGSEVTFTLFWRAGMTNEQFAQDQAMVENDLETLRAVLERENHSNP